MSPLAACPDCGAPLARRTREATGAHGTARVDVQWPALACPEGHRFHVHPDFGALFIDAFTERLRTAYAGALTPATRRPLRRRPSCPGCDARLSHTPAGAVDAEVFVDVPEVGPVAVRARLPSYACERCGQRAGWLRQAEDDLVEALAESIEAAAIRHLPRFRGRRSTRG